MKKSYLLLIVMLFNIHGFSQQLELNKGRERFNKKAKEVDKMKVDSVISYNYKTKKRQTLELSFKAFETRMPHIGNYTPKEINSIHDFPTKQNSNISLLYRTREIFESNQFFPSSAVTKIIKYHNGKSENTCTATFIDERFLITATHCILNTENKNPDSIIVKILYDNDKSTKEVLVKNIYYNSKYRPISLDSDCYDIALLELEEPLGKELGYIGVLSDNENNKHLNKWNKLYNFSYPHTNFAKKLQEKINPNNDSIKNATLSQIIEKINLHTPDFSITNQYFTIGRFFLNDKKNITYQIPYAIGGQSGSAWISEDYYLYGVTSKWVEQFGNKSFDCRLREDILSSYMQIISNSKK